MPREAVQQSRPLPISVIELEESWAQRDLKICTNPRLSLSPFAQALIDHLVAKSCAEG